MQVGGVHSGTVTGILLPTRPGEKVTVVMELAKSTHEIIKQDSVASIQTEGLLGNQYLAISFGSAGQADVKNGEIIQSEPPLRWRICSRRRTAFWIAASRPFSTREATAHLNSVSAKIDSGQGTLGALAIRCARRLRIATAGRRDPAGTYPYARAAEPRACCLTPSEV